MNGLMYLVGAVFCFVWRWMLWIQRQPEGVPLFGFWADRKHIATNVCSLIVTLITMGLWMNGILTAGFDSLIPDNWLPVGVLRVVWWFSLPVGFVVTWATRRVVKWLNSFGGGDDE